jgi:hypothetical protein
MRSTSWVYFTAFVLLAAAVCIALPLLLTHGR